LTHSDNNPFAGNPFFRKTYNNIDQILKLLHKDTGPTTHLYVLVHGAQAVDAYDLRTILFHSGIPKTSLLTEKAIYDGIEVAPYLITLEDREDIERQLSVHGWGKGWGIFLTSDFDVDTCLSYGAFWKIIGAANC
jgi:hypothetical protein